MRLPVESLRALREVIRTGNVTAAGRRLNLTQSAVSWKLRRLEDQVGRSLLWRDGRRLEPTADGRALAAHAERILEAHDTAVAQLSAPPLNGRLVLGASESVSTEGLTPLLARLTRAHPELDIRVRIDQSPALGAALDDGRLDLAVLKVYGDEIRAQDVVLWEDQLIWVGSESQPVPGDDPLPYISFGPDCFYHPVASRALADAGRTFRIVLESPALRTVRDAVAAGLGIAILDRTTVGHGTVELPELNAAAPLPTATYVVRAGRSIPDRLAHTVTAEIVAGMAPVPRLAS